AFQKIIALNYKKQIDAKSATFNFCTKKVAVYGIEDEIIKKVHKFSYPIQLMIIKEASTVIDRNFLPSSPLVDIPLRTPPRIPSPAPTIASLPNPLTRFINFITPGQCNNLSPPRHTVYSVHTEETDPIPPIIVNINPPNEEPIRTPTPEAPLVNQPGRVDEALLPPPPPVQNLLPPNNMAQAQALTDATNAINALAIVLGQEEFRRAAKANKWNNARRLELAMAYMKDNAQEWASSLANAPNHFQNDNHGQNDHN
ncbi:16241_t:CDS:2, partial [Gigaspora margarita]